MINRINKKLHNIGKELEQKLDTSIMLKSEEYRFKSRECYFNSYRHIWQMAIKYPECIEYDRGLFRLNQFSINEEITFEEIFSIFKKADIGTICTEKLHDPHTVVSDISKKDRTTLTNQLKELIKEDAIEEEDLSKVFEDYYEDSDDIFEALSYWSVYFEPKCYFDEELAYKCRLTPFKYYNEETGEKLNLLALGGCGMDLSPKLDAYQALTVGSIDKKSCLFDPYNGKNCFEHVVGKELTKEVLANIILEVRKYSFEFLLRDEL